MNEIIESIIQWYEENIKELLSDDFDTFLIESLDYDLDGIIDHAKNTRLGNNAGQGEGYVERIIEVLKQQKIPYPSYYKDKELNDAIDYAVYELPSFAVKPLALAMGI